jgi:hypothetical protein
MEGKIIGIPLAMILFYIAIVAPFGYGLVRLYQSNKVIMSDVTVIKQSLVSVPVETESPLLQVETTPFPELDPTISSKKKTPATLSTATSASQIKTN